ncbi:heat shock protein [Trema orientale]|uniref:Heat shock protein n=1 Tax=Trema orientale TaxID=63057 RepID=A0A2P5F7D2_TREOI|nr:heat shock protein [Trema orientale]
MALSLLLKWRTLTTALPPWPRARSFRSDAALEAIAKASQDKLHTLVLYNYPSFSGAFSALFAHLFHSRLNLPSLILPFSSVEPLRVEDLCTEGLERLYLLDFFGSKGFAEQLSRRASFEVIGFDHRKSVLAKIPCEEDCPANLTFHLNVEKSSSMAVYEYFSAKLAETKHFDGMIPSLLESKDRDRVEMILKHIEDIDLCRWNLPDTKAFSIGLNEWRSKFNCLTNPYMYEQLMEIDSTDLIAKGNSYVSTREKGAEKLLDKVFKVRLGRGFYGECLGVRVDINTNLVDEIGKKLSVRSAAAGHRPIGAVIYMLRNNLKMCLRSTDSSVDTSEVAKAYGGGGSSSSSSFIIRMDEYNQWLL